MRFSSRDGIKERGQRKYLPLAEGKSIGIHSCPLACPTSDIAVALAGQSLLGLRLQLIRVLGDGGQDVVEHSRRIDLILVCAVRVLDFVGVRHGLGTQAKATETIVVDAVRPGYEQPPERVCNCRRGLSERSACWAGCRRGVGLALSMPRCVLKKDSAVAGDDGAARKVARL